MKQKSIILIMSIFLSQNFHSQTVKIDYIETKNIPAEKLAQLPPQVVQMLSKEVKCTLVNSKGNSLFQFQEENTGNLGMNIEAPKRDAYYKNYTNNEIITLAVLDDEKFIVKDVLPKIDWKIETESQKIGEYDCQKATALYKNATIIAWFCNAIPVNDGPLMLNGLPGLIIKVSINNMITYAASKIVVEKENILIPTFSEGKKIATEDFQILKAKVAEEKLARQKEAGSTHIEVK